MVRKNARMTPPWVTTTIAPSGTGWWERILESAPSNLSSISSSVSASAKAQRSSSGRARNSFGELGVAGLLFGPGMTLEDAAVTLREPRHGDDLPGEAGLARHYLGGLEGPGEGACVDAGDSLHPSRHGPRLAAWRRPSSERGKSS
jgi:hypothetical protein